jgi:hypothetical protein
LEVNIAKLKPQWIICDYLLLFSQSLFNRFMKNIFGRHKSIVDATPAQVFYSLWVNRRFPFPGRDDFYRVVCASS